VQSDGMRFMFPVLMLLSACAPAASALDSRVFSLAYLDDGPFAPRATIRFVAPEQIEGQAPCNRYGARLTATLPAFAPAGITSTEMACEALAAEAVFFEALGEMTSAEIEGDTLTLRSPEGRIMVFKSQD
jgi:heat shock protein HslJ